MVFFKMLVEKALELLARLDPRATEDDPRYKEYVGAMFPNAASYGLAPTEEQPPKIDIRSILAEKYDAPDLAWLDDFVEKVGEVESKGGEDTVSRLSSARGIYQFLTEGENNAFQTALNRTAATYASAGQEIPSWVEEARKHNDPNRLPAPWQKDVMLANLFQQPGTDELFKKILAGDKKAQLEMYGKYHHTKPNVTKDKRIVKIFSR